MSEELTPYQRALADLERQREEVERLRREEVEKVIQDIKQKIQLYGISLKDLGYDYLESSQKGRESGQEKLKDGRASVTPKFRGPQGELWSGRGKTPTWLTELLAKGHNRDEYLIRKEES